MKHVPFIIRLRLMLTDNARHVARKQQEVFYGYQQKDIHVMVQHWREYMTNVCIEYIRERMRKVSEV